MEDDSDLPISNELDIEAQRKLLAERLGGKSSGKYARVLLAALSGIPWIGSLLGAAGVVLGEAEQGQLNQLQRLWLEEHQQKLKLLGTTLAQVIERLDLFGEEFQERIQSDEYLTLIRKSFRAWDKADTEEKRELIRKLITNAGGMKLSPDDLVRLFIDWIDTYHESHFAVIRTIYREPLCTRARIWQDIHGAPVREDSAEADLFKLLIRDLSTGGVIRQRKPTNYYGEFVRQKPKAASRQGSVHKSAFDDQDEYELTELGKRFVHYTMTELVPQVRAI